MDRSSFIKTLSGEASGRRQDLTRALLGMLEPAYRTVVRRRNASFDRHPAKSVAVTVPVISIGNLTTGGTGKTPMVRWLADLLHRDGQRPVIVSRGYGSRPGQPNDEARELALYLPDVPHIQTPDRVAAAHTAIREHAAGSIVMDDGFQHRRLQRNLDIVLVDATCPFGFDHLLPRGLLREPVASLSRASAVVLTRCDQVPASRLDEITRRIESWLPANRIARVVFEVDGCMDTAGTIRPVGELPGSMLGFCGIGNPAAFQSSLASQSVSVADFVSWPDHHRYRESDLQQLETRARAASASGLICTVKDLVKLQELSPPALPLRALVISARFESGEDMLRQLAGELFDGHPGTVPPGSGECAKKKPASRE